MPKVSYSPQSQKQVQRPPGQGQSKNAKKRAARKLGLKFSAASMAMPRAARQVRVRPKRAPGMFASRGDQVGFPTGRTVNSNAKGRLNTIVEFDEFVADLTGQAAFVAAEFPIQPGLAVTFPQGSVEAALYTEWKMLDCEFYYKPEVTQFTTNANTGKVILAVDYNALNGTPTTKAQVEIMDRNDAMPYNDIRLRIDARQVNRADSKYIRTGPVGNGADLKTYDGGNLWACTVGQGGTITKLGELRVRYRFLCEKPTLLNAGVAVAAKSSSAFTRVTAQTFTTATPAALAYDAPYVDALGWGAGSSGVYTPPAGAYLIHALASCKDTVAEAFQISVQIFKNGVAAVPSLNQFENEGTTATAQPGTIVSVQGLLVLNGTDTVQINYTMTGAAGTLSALGGACLLVTLA